MGLKILTKEKLINKLCIIIGTRPSIVKQSPIIRELVRQSVQHFIIHTGQHYSFELDQALFFDLELPEPHFRLKGIKDCKMHGQQTAEMLRQIEHILVKEKPKTVLVGGDANTNLAGALAARKLNINLAHEEAGLRSFKWNVPEEHNRVIIDHISDYLFVPHENAKRQLQKEGIRGRIFISGSTITDAITENLNIARKKSSILDTLSLKQEKYIVLTVHHEENVDYVEELSNIVAGMKHISRAIGYPIIFPIHPRTRQRLKHFGLYNKLFEDNNIRAITPLGYFDFLVLVAYSLMAVTDSGGVIQESAILHIPCLTLGKYTEWRECVELGANKISMNDPNLMEKYAMEFINEPADWPNPFGEPGAAGRIVDILKKSFTDPPIE